MLKFLIIAAVFWFNPLVSNIDVLPDLVAYLLVIKAFSKYSYVNDGANDVCVSAKKMSIISGAKILSITLVSSFDPTMSLLLSFGFGLVEAIFGIPFFKKLFNAYSHLVSAENGEVYSLAEGKMKRFTIVAFVLRLALAILPDLTALSLNSAFTLDTDYTYLRFRPIFIGFSVIVSLVIGTAWLVRYISFVKKLVTKELNRACNSSFSSAVGNKEFIFVAKNNMRMIVLSIIGVVSVADITWGYTNVDIFQDFLLVFLVTLSFLFLFFKGYYKIGKHFILLVVALGLSVGAAIFEIKANLQYFESYSLASIFKVSEAEDMYFTLCISAVVSSITLIAAFVIVLLSMKENARSNIIKYSDLFSQSDIEYYLKEFSKTTKRKMIGTVAFATLSSIVYVLMVIFKPYAEWTILLNMVCEVVLIISYIGFSLYIYDEVYKRILTFS